MKTIEVNNKVVEIISSSTTLNSVSIVVATMNPQEAYELFLNVDNLTIMENDVMCGIYQNISFSSATIDASGNVTVTFLIKSNIDVKLEAIATTQAEHDEILAEILYGTEEEV